MKGRNVEIATEGLQSQHHAAYYNDWAIEGYLQCY
jgi:hypothetical protein